MNVQELLTRAERTNRARDALEREHGFGAVSDQPADLIIRIVIIALEAGIQSDDWDCVAEAAEMLAKLANYYPWKAQTRKGKPI
jgi:hypothetical protein